MTSTPTRKRLLYFSLHTFFVLTTMLCVWLGLKIREVKQQKEAIDWVEGFGGTLWYREDFPGFAKRNPPPRSNAWLRRALGDENFPVPIMVRFELMKPGPTDLSQLEYLPTLRVLTLGTHDQTDISSLAELMELRTLVLSCSADLDLTPLKELTNLKYLVLFGCEQYSKMRELREALPECDISNSASTATSLPLE